jgi:hypothetical protein
MKLIKRLSAAALSVAVAATMALSVSATTYEDAVQAAKDAGVQDINVQELQNFLEANADYFTSDDYDHMIEVLNEVKETYVTPLAMELFGKTPDELTEDEKWELGQHWSQDDRAAIIGALTSLGDEYNVEVDVDALSKGEYTVEASIVKESDSNGDDDSDSDSDSDEDSDSDKDGDSDDEDGSSTTTPAATTNNGGSNTGSSNTGSTTTSQPNTQIVVTDPIADTGADVETGVNGGVVAGAGLAILLAATGVVLVARKNKE